MKKIKWIIALQTLLASGSFMQAQTPLIPRDSTIKGPQSFAMIVGISKYKFVRPLNYADKDAELFRDFLKSPGGGRVKDENIFTLLNENALNANFWGKGFQWLKAKDLRAGDKLFIYLAGHGDAIDEDQFFFLGYDCNPAGDKNNYLVGGAIQLFNLKKKIANETAKGVDVIFIMDACRTNELPGGLVGQNFLNSAISEKKAGEIMMLATAAGEESLEDASIGNGHGLFTYYLVDGLTGSADSPDSPDQKISFGEIQKYVDTNVPSVALERFKRKQDPFFCCEEKSGKIISMVDTAYLGNWLKLNKLQNRGGGNSFSGMIEKQKTNVADTALIETYNRFYSAIRANTFTGPSSAEDYYLQLNKKFPGNPYTLDAKSTLAVEFINDAQKRVNRYLDCSDNASREEKQGNYDAAFRLQKAISILKEDDPEFANSYISRMFFLMAGGDYGKDGKNGDISIAFEKAYAALAIDRDKAYIFNKLAQLHLQNNQPDSAVYYSEKAVRLAPKWTCAITTLTLARKVLNYNNPDSNKKISTSSNSKIHFGIVAGGGISKPSITSTELTFGNLTKYKALGVKSKAKIDLGIIGQFHLTKYIDMRPSVLVSFDKSNIDFERSDASSNRRDTQTLSVNITSLAVPVPIIFRFSDKNVSPYFAVGPTFSYLMQKKDGNAENLPVKSFDILADAGFGLDIGIQKAGIVISPEIKYSRGLIDTHETSSSIYSNVITKLNRQGFTFSIYMRRR